MGKVFNHNKGGEIIPRALIFDCNLSDRARFVYCYMSAKPEGWDFYLTPMAKELGYSVDTLRKYMRELSKAGWITKGDQNIDEDTNKFGCVDWTINSKPYSKKAVSEKNRDGKIPTQDNNSSINTPIEENKEEKRNINISKKTKDIILSDEEKAFIKSMTERYPRVMSMDKPLTLEQAKKLKEKYDEDLLRKILDDMENWKKLLKNSVSAYLTISNWCKRELDRA